MSVSLIAQVTNLPKELCQLVFEYYDFTPITRLFISQYHEAVLSYQLNLCLNINMCVKLCNDNIESLVHYIASNTENIQQRWLTDRTTTEQGLLFQFSEAGDSQNGLYWLMPYLVEFINFSNERSLSDDTCFIAIHIDCLFFDALFQYACSGVYVKPDITH